MKYINVQNHRYRGITFALIASISNLHVIFPFLNNVKHKSGIITFIDRVAKIDFVTIFDLGFDGISLYCIDYVSCRLQGRAVDPQTPKDSGVGFCSGVEN